jgi:RNase P subunit RPR2
MKQTLCDRCGEKILDKKVKLYLRINKKKWKRVICLPCLALLTVFIDDKDREDNIKKLLDEKNV